MEDMVGRARLFVPVQLSLTLIQVLLLLPIFSFVLLVVFSSAFV